MDEPYVSLLDYAVNEEIYVEDGYDDPFLFAAENCPTSFINVDIPTLCYVHNRNAGFTACYDCWMRPYDFNLGDNDGKK